MILKAIALENIRSYTNEAITFSEGATLLSGDIGSGKTTILLALEFALFGLMKGSLSGSELLRHGSNTGSVTFNFSIDNRSIEIKRTLRRSKDKVQQTAGHIIIDGTKKECTPVELKSEVLQHLGYPAELVTKTKDIIFRFTVYTPQEAMRQILLEDKETRMNILRRVFGIDKYRAIKENSAVYVRVLREKKKVLEGFMQDLELKKEERDNLFKELNAVKEMLAALEPRLKILQDDYRQQRESLSLLEKDMAALQKAKEEIARCEGDVLAIAKQRQQQSRDIELLQEELKREDVLDPAKIGEVRLKEVQKQLEKVQQEQHQNLLSLQEIKVKQQHADHLKQSIERLDDCPTCKQEVSREYKQNIIVGEDKKIILLEKEKENIALKNRDFEKKIIEIKKSLEEEKEKEKKLLVIKEKLKNIEEKKIRLNRLLDLQDELKKRAAACNQKKAMLQEEMKKVEGKEEAYQIKKKEVDEVQQKERELAVKHSGLKSSLEGMQNGISTLDHDIKKKEQAQKKSERISLLQQWFNDYFMHLMNSIEKQVLLKVYGEFNRFFVDWFSKLIEDESITSRLDDGFSPLITQNGYDTEMNNLSGGEKTSCALAYRLALNKVINDVVSTIKTKDLLILDEPTDGFSSHQLDRMKDVLDELQTRQVIIVSHEAKMEGFVDHIVRIQKTEHESKVSV